MVWLRTRRPVSTLHNGVAEDVVAGTVVTTAELVLRAGEHREVQLSTEVPEIKVPEAGVAEIEAVVCMHRSLADPGPTEATGVAFVTTAEAFILFSDQRAIVCLRFLIRIREVFDRESFDRELIAVPLRSIVVSGLVVMTTGCVPRADWLE